MLLAAAPLHAQVIESFTEPFRKVELTPAETGILTLLTVKEGDRVRKDQTIGSLDCDVQEIAQQIAHTAMQSRGRLDSALAEQELRKKRLDKLNELRATGHATQEEIHRAAADLSVAEANVLTANEQRVIDTLEHKKLAAMIERRRLRSPLNGVVTRVLRDENDYVGGNAAHVLTVMQLDPLRATFSVPTQHAALLIQNQKVPISLADSGETTLGKVELVSPVTDAESGTVRVKVLIENADGKYRCGVRCSLDLDRQR